MCTFWSFLNALDEAARPGRPNGNAAYRICLPALVSFSSRSYDRLAERDVFLPGVRVASLGGGAWFLPLVARSWFVPYTGFTIERFLLLVPSNACRNLRCCPTAADLLSNGR